MTIPTIIPTFKGHDRLPRVLECIEKQGPDIDMPTFIRDNNTNGVYYTKAVNEGLLKYAFLPGIEFCLVLCDDVYLAPGCVHELFETAQRYPGVGIFSPIQRNEQDAITWAGSLRSWPYGAHQVKPSANVPYFTYWPSGAVFLVRTAMIKQIGLMDDGMRFVCSDADFGLTARARRWQCMVVPKAGAIHEFNLSTAKNTDLELSKIKLQDFLYFTRKWVTGDQFRRLEYDSARLTESTVAAQERDWIRTLDLVNERLNGEN